MNIRFKQAINLFKETAYEGFSFNPATIEEINIAEKELNATLPESYKAFQLELGDIDWAMLEIYSVKTPPEGRINIIGITQSERTQCFPNMPDSLIPFSDDGGGDSYCFDTSKITDGECNIVFWDHASNSEQEPTIVAKDFVEWINKEIEWRLEEDV